MKIRYIYILLFVVFIISCNEKNKIKDYKVIEADTLAKIEYLKINGKSNCVKNNEIIELKKNINDSLINYFVNKYKTKFVFVIDKLFNFENVGFDYKYFDLKFIENNIKIYDFDEYYLITINYKDSWQSEEGNIICLYLIDASNNIIASDTINGCHYYNGDLEIKDWDVDKKKDIVYTIIYPTQCIPVETDNLLVISFNYKTNKLYEKFELETGLRTCYEKSEDSCEFIERKYNFSKNKDTIYIKQNNYIFNKGDFDWDFEVKNKKMISRNFYHYILDSDGLIYNRID